MAANELGKTMSPYVALVSLLPAYLSLKNIKSHVWTFTRQLFKCSNNDCIPLTLSIL